MPVPASCVFTLAFDYGLYQILMAVRLGARLIVCKSFAFPAQVFNEINRTQASVFPGVPTVFSTLIGIHHKTPCVFPPLRALPIRPLLCRQNMCRF